MIEKLSYEARSVVDRFLTVIVDDCEHSVYCDWGKCKYNGETVCCSTQIEAMKCAIVAFELMFRENQSNLRSFEISDILRELKTQVYGKEN